jgi:hypothetical protein
MADPSETFGPNEAADVPTEDVYARWARSFGITDGVVNTTNSYDPADLRVSANGSTNVTIQAGEANVGGLWYRNSLAVTRPIPANAGTTPRIDAVVLRMDNALNEVSVKYVKGTSVLPPMVRTFGLTWDLRLATVTVPSGATTVAPAGVTDRRQFLVPGLIGMGTGTPFPDGIPGQLMARPGGRILQCQEDGSWLNLLPLPDPVWTRFQYPSEGEIRDYVDGAGSGYYRGAWAKFADGTIRLRGLVESAAGTLAYGAIGTGNTMKRITIHGDDNPDESGKIRIADGLASGGWLSLDGIAFWSAQA